MFADHPFIAYVYLVCKLRVYLLETTIRIFQI